MLPNIFTLSHCSATLHLFPSDSFHCLLPLPPLLLLSNYSYHLLTLLPSPPHIPPIIFFPLLHLLPLSAPSLYPIICPTPHYCPSSSPPPSLLAPPPSAVLHLRLPSIAIHHLLHPAGPHYLPHVPLLPIIFPISHCSPLSDTYPSAPHFLPPIPLLPIICPIIPLLPIICPISHCSPLSAPYPTAPHYLPHILLLPVICPISHL